MKGTLPEDFDLQAWKDRYAEVVWAKCGSYPWWPSYVFDPDLLSPGEESYEQAHKIIGKSYVVLFYADRTLGFAIPKNMKPFNEENNAIYSKQKVGKKYEAKFIEAMRDAHLDVVKTKEDRLNWYFDHLKIGGYFQDEDDSVSEEAIDVIPCEVRSISSLAHF